MQRACVIIGLAIMATCVASCGDDGVRVNERINGAGSSFIYPMMSKWAGEYEKATGVHINYHSIGSGGGTHTMTVQTADFACCDGPMKEEHLKEAES